MKQFQKRATFEDVRNAQNVMRKWIDRLITDNEPLSPTDREKFIKTSQLASLGIGTKQPFFFKTKTKAHSFPHIESAVYWVAYLETTPVNLDGDMIDIRLSGIKYGRNGVSWCSHMHYKKL